MTPSPELLSVLGKAASGTRKTGFTTGGVTLTINQQNDTVTATATVTVDITTNSTTGALVISAKDFLDFPPTPSV